VSYQVDVIDIELLVVSVVKIMNNVTLSIIKEAPKEIVNYKQEPTKDLIWNRQKRRKSKKSKRK
jgi:hypothetical protein